MGADKDGRDVSCAMGVSSQVGDVLTGRLCVCVCGGDSGVGFWRQIVYV